MNTVKRPSVPALFFSHKEKETVLSSIKAAEKATSGEIRLHIDRKHGGDIMQTAAQVFEKLGMTNTEARNGVLVYFAIQNRQFAILGDKGIFEKLGQNWWEGIAAGMARSFQQDEFASGLAWGIGQIGDVLKSHFPYQTDDVNELPDDLSFGR